MDRKPRNSFEQIKPFLRMLERSIDDARHRRLGSPVDEDRTRPSLSNGSGPADPSGPTVTQSAPGPDVERPQRATPIRPKTQIRPTGLSY